MRQIGSKVNNVFFFLFFFYVFRVVVTVKNIELILRISRIMNFAAPDCLYSIIRVSIRQSTEIMNADLYPFNCF